MGRSRGVGVCFLRSCHSGFLGEEVYWLLIGGGVGSAIHIYITTFYILLPCEDSHFVCFMMFNFRYNINIFKNVFSFASIFSHSFQNYHSNVTFTCRLQVN